MAGITAFKFYQLFPKELTDKHWQKKKGLVGKTVKTGLGAELKKIEAMHSKFDSAKLDPAGQSPSNMAALEKEVAAAIAEYKRVVVPMQKQLKVIKATAESAAKTLGKKTLGKDAAKAATAAAKAADFYGVSCKSIDLQSSITEAKEKIAKKNALAKQFLDGSIKKFAIGVKKFLADPTEKSWADNIKQNGRSVSNSVKQLDAYNKKFWREFQKFQGFDVGTLKLAGRDDFAEVSVEIVKKAMKQVKEIAAFKPS